MEKHDDSDLRTIANLAVDWKRERMQWEQLMQSVNNSVDHLSKGQERIFRLLESMETKLGNQGERLTRTEERGEELGRIVVDRGRTFDRHIDEHWKQSALNLSIIGLFMAVWKFVAERKFP